MSTEACPDNCSINAEKKVVLLFPLIFSMLQENILSAALHAVTMTYAGQGSVAVDIVIDISATHHVPAAAMMSAGQGSDTALINIVNKSRSLSCLQPCMLL